MAIRTTNSYLRRSTTAYRGENYSVADIGLRFGYYYAQQSWANNDYYQFDIAPNGDNRYLGGYRANAGTVGMDVSVKKFGGDKLSTHHFYADLLIGWNISPKAYAADASQRYYNTKIDEHFRRERFGTRIGYEYTRFGTGRFGVTFGAEFQLKPTIRYVPNRDYWAPRGGEALMPFAVILKSGMIYRL